MIDTLKIYVLWHPQSLEAKADANLISHHFDNLGIERGGIKYRVPVRTRSEPWKPDISQEPRKIDFSEADHNIIVLLNDSYMNTESQTWNGYLNDIQSQIVVRKDNDLIVPFHRSKNLSTFNAISHIHFAHQYKWQTSIANKEAENSRLLLHLLYAIRNHLRKIWTPKASKEKLFVSHAKSDGDYTARVIVDHVNDTSHDVPLHTFYDAMELIPGEKYQDTFDQEIENGTLLAIISDIYESRPWCLYELTKAKEYKRPIVLADISKTKISRSYPYGGNLPRIRLKGTDFRTIEGLLVEVLSEGLRCDLFVRQANKAIRNKKYSNAISLPRPPELFDILNIASKNETIIYPDPPLPNIEQKILKKATNSISPFLEIKSLGEM